MVPVDPTMDIAQQLLPLFDGHAALLDLDVASPVEIPSITKKDLA